MNVKTNYLLIMTSDKMSVLISGKTLPIKEFETKIGSSCAAFEDLWWLYKMGKWAQIVVSNNTAENTFKWSMGRSKKYAILPYPESFTGSV